MTLTALPSSAQTTAGMGSCTGKMTGTVGLSLPAPGYGSITAGLVAMGVFGQAECECSKAANPTNDTVNLNLEIKLTANYPTGTSSIVELWVGSPSVCMDVTNRQISPLCKKVQTNILVDDFTNRVSHPNGLIHIPIPADLLTDPSSRKCDPSQGAPASSQNSIFLFVLDGTTAQATCELDVTQKLLGPSAPDKPTVQSGDSGVTVNWSNISTGSNTPRYFQVLCADANGAPLTGTGSHSQAYSICVDGQMRRKDLTIGGGTVPSDGGVATTSDAGTYLLPAPAPASTPRFVDDGGVSDSDGGVGDGGAGNPVDLGPFASLDPSFICTDPLEATQNAARIGGLINNQTYRFLVLAIDAYGNATPSPVTDPVVPRATEDLWRRYRAAGGSGGCFIATAAFGSYESGWVKVLRDFRDQVLLEHGWGRRFVAWYYQHSPPLADLIASHEWARVLTRIALLPPIGIAWLWLHLPAWLLGALALLGAFAVSLGRSCRSDVRLAK